MPPTKSIRKNDKRRSNPTNASNSKHVTHANTTHNNHNNHINHNNTATILLPNEKEVTIGSILRLTLFLITINYFLQVTYRIRLLAIVDFGTVIHEFDPYFNFRATEYLYNHGTQKFFTWFDYQSWYPLGRPVGTTIYPGMQFTAVWIKRYFIDQLWTKIIGICGGGGCGISEMSLNDVCCYIPAWFGILASMIVGLIAHEVTLERNTKQTIGHVVQDLIMGSTSRHDGAWWGDDDEEEEQEEEDTRSDDRPFMYLFGDYSSPALECGVFSMGIMGMVPAHLTRSVGGGFDNESVAMSALCLTFYFWVRSLRSGDKYSYLYGILTGLSYFYMAATWGGYVFVLNMIGLHAGLLVIMGRFTLKLYRSYSIFYVVGTILAMQIPVVSMAPLKSLEQLGPLILFLGFQVLYYCQIQIRKRKLKRLEAMSFRIQIFAIAISILVAVLYISVPTGYFGPISSRVRGLFVKHTKTGNPLVDSVAEHQPADNSAYFRYLQHLCTFCPIGFIMILFNFGDGASFVMAYAMTAYFFSHKMVRLILLMGPVASILGGIAYGRMSMWCINQVWSLEEEDSEDLTNGRNSGGISTSRVESKRKKKGTARKGKGSGNASEPSFDHLGDFAEPFVRQVVAVTLLFMMVFFAASFQTYCLKIARAMSNPTIIAVGQTKEGNLVKIDDYREAYWWINDNTPEDSRVLAWWDYGYQISAIANRTTLADGNTWNHEHIALLGKILTTDADEGYSIARHLADYVLVWAGGGGDDLAKSPHLARIANSVYRDLCPEDPTCRAFGFMNAQRTPSPMMEASFLYKLHSHNLVPGVQADPDKFREVFRSKYGKVRVFKILGVDEGSKAWAADPKNRICDIEGGWFCKGQYPPALKEVIEDRLDFTQLEDFNRDQKVDSEYQKQYFENLNNPEQAKAKYMNTQPNHGSNGIIKNPTAEEIRSFYSKWEDTEQTTKMWEMINSGDVKSLDGWLRTEPLMAHMRSSDGRGPMWWAFESRKQDIVKVLMAHGVSHGDKDVRGFTPVDLLDS